MTPHFRVWEAWQGAVGGGFLSRKAHSRARDSRASGLTDRAQAPAPGWGILRKPGSRLPRAERGSAGKQRLLHCKSEKLEAMANVIPGRVKPLSSPSLKIKSRQFRGTQGSQLRRSMAPSCEAEEARHERPHTARFQSPGMGGEARLHSQQSRLVVA